MNSDQTPVKVPLEWIDPATVHTALRKGVDDEWSVLLWNMVYPLDADVWARFIKDIRDIAEADDCDWMSAVRAVVSEYTLLDRAFEAFVDGEGPRPEPDAVVDTHDYRALKWAWKLCLEHDDTIYYLGKALASWAALDEGRRSS